MLSFPYVIDVCVELNEFDMNITKNNQLLVNHDNTIDHMANKTEIMQLT